MTPMTSGSRREADESTGEMHETDTTSGASGTEAAVPSTLEELDLNTIADFPLLATCLTLWKENCVDGKLPAHLNVERVPEEVLGYTMLLDFIPEERDALVRIVGNYVGERATFRAAGMTVRGFFDERDAQIVNDALCKVAASRVPSLARRTHVVIHGEQASYVRLILPLSNNGRIVTGFFKAIEPSSLSAK